MKTTHLRSANYFIFRLFFFVSMCTVWSSWLYLLLNIMIPFGDAEYEQDDAIEILGEIDGVDKKKDKDKEKEKDESSAKRTQERIKQQLRKGARKIEGRVGYTPVYYDPPLKSDGTLAKSCLKGRSGKKPLRTGLVFNETKPKVFNYPPEEDPIGDEG